MKQNSLVAESLQFCNEFKLIWLLNQLPINLKEAPQKNTSKNNKTTKHYSKLQQVTQPKKTITQKEIPKFQETQQPEDDNFHTLLTKTKIGVKDSPNTNLQYPTISNISSKPSNISSHPSNISSQPSNISSKPSNISSQPSNISSQPKNLQSSYWTFSGQNNKPVQPTYLLQTQQPNILSTLSSCYSNRSQLDCNHLDSKIYPNVLNSTLLHQYNPKGSVEGVNYQQIQSKATIHPAFTKSKKTFETPKRKNQLSNNSPLSKSRKSQRALHNPSKSPVKVNRTEVIKNQCGQAQNDVKTIKTEENQSIDPGLEEYINLISKSQINAQPYQLDLSYQS